MAITREAELLLCCARTRLTPALTARIGGLLRDHLDWDFIVAQAIAHGVAPLLYFHLAPHSIPAAARESLRAKSIAETRWNLFIGSELKRLMAVFQQHGIAAAPFKGVSLASQVYGDLALREGGDLDILLGREQALAARQLLLDLGYQPEYQLTPRQTRDYLHYHYAFVLSHPEHGVVVELHWRIAPRHFSVDLDFDGILNRLEPAPFDDHPIPGLCREDLLLALCIHGARHCWERLIWLTDVAELLALPRPLDWPAILSRAEGLGVRRYLLLALRMSAEFLAAPLPDEIRRNIAREPQIAKATVKWLKLFQKPAAEQGLIARMPFHLQCRERFTDRLRYTFRLLTTTTVEDWRLVSLPESLAFLYLFLRVPRLLRKYRWLHIS